MVALRDLTQLGDDLGRLAGALEALTLGADLSSVAIERDRLARTIRDYLIPRAEDPEMPLIVVFAGPTGSGKSTLINSLTGLELSLAGPLRPTTTGPVVLTDAPRRHDFDSISGVDCEVVAGRARILESMVLVDTPDIDSTSTDHRRMAETLIDSADVVVFVTSALRYADAVPWQVLRRAESRGTDVIHVLNRVGSSTRGAVIDFQARLGAAGLADDVINVPEHRVAAGAQSLPRIAVRSLRRRLASLAGDRSTTAERAFDRVLLTTLRQVGALEVELTEAADSLALLRSQMMLELTARASSLDLSGVAGWLIDPPAGVTNRQARRWRWSSRRGDLTSAEVDDLIGAIESLLVRDVRLWLADLPAGGFGPRVEPSRVLSVIVPVARLAMEGWIDFVRRIARDEAGRRAGLGEVVLVVSATDLAETTAARALFGDLADEIVARARRELVGRLEVVYEQVAALVTELAEVRSDALDVNQLRTALEAVTSTLAPVDA